MGLGLGFDRALAIEGVVRVRIRVRARVSSA